MDLIDTIKVIISTHASPSILTHVDLFYNFQCMLLVQRSYSINFNMIWHICFISKVLSYLVLLIVDLLLFSSKMLLNIQLLLLVYHISTLYYNAVLLCVLAPAAASASAAPPQQYGKKYSNLLSICVT